MSCLYHALKVNKAKRVFRVIDHCTIFLLIAGTYTPYTLITLHGPTGWILFGIVWGVGILGIVLNAVLPGKDYEFKQDDLGSTSVNFQV